MVRVLGIETSRQLCSAALLLDGTVREDTRKMARAHNEHILGLIDGLFATAGLTPQELDGVAFGCGPGSFTGVRIAAAVAQALALGAGASVAPVSSTLALAVAAIEQLPVEEGVVVSIRSRRDAFYLASFRIADGEPAACRGDQLLTACPDWADFANGWPLVGDPPPWLPADASVLSEVTVGAGLIARLGARALAEGGGLDPELGLPAYVQGDSPWATAS
ncbi:MAG: tRNA (adenosine(37)-N6)-threonylcarbamoyltransferase complex dimerization subunit type 1 TsaB [Gammaproteobacteria bacterium]|nr:tRNA (adenosine(37)-N6)-threonylcarbamoyltransferase complex dimerization subunit type 1 TsaB [Gammaproteobacteria bacterium]MYK84620.1 tRNA (adenosine(37)-N6)-threonylcarbamoyltransferase complex dimerization subunit type 1 TsaB [Gammaproteobacteria bacterium]